ncbi:MAG: hypothetical protein AAF329_06385 [Cyanobacteria bacterium P01_A01_bin.17]
MVERTPANLQTTAIRQMDPAIIDRLRLAFPKKYFGIERVPSTFNLTEFKRVVRLSPFIGVAWVGFKKDPASGRILKGSHQWRLVLVLRASNGLEARFKGDHSDVGMDAMFDVASALFHGFTMDGIGAVSVTDGQSVYAQGYEDDDTTIAHINFEIDYSTQVGALNLKNAADFDALNITWSMTDPETPEGDPDIEQTIQFNEEEEV